MDKVATLHVPYKKALITSALKDADFMVQTMTTADAYHYRLDNDRTMIIELFYGSFP